MTDTHPDGRTLDRRIRTAAGIVVMAAERAEEQPVDAVTALAVWQVFTGIDDVHEALAYARRRATK